MTTAIKISEKSMSEFNHNKNVVGIEQKDLLPEPPVFINIETGEQFSRETMQKLSTQMSSVYDQMKQLIQPFVWHVFDEPDKFEDLFEMFRKECNKVTNIAYRI